MTLATKIQYKNFEPGEFTDKKERTYEETVQLINHFPWEQQRDHLVVDLTNPSVTLQDKEGNFLKLALYYQGKFVLHYLTTQKRLYTKSLSHVEDAFPYLRSFFETNPFDTDGFQLENSWIHSKAIHFQDQDFTYRMNPVKSWLLMGLYTLFLVTYIIIISGFFISYSGPGALRVILLIFLCFIVMASFVLAVLINHYRNARGKILIMSKGNDIFYYGDRHQPEKYDKRDITSVIAVGNKNGRNRSLSYTCLEMGLTAPNLFIPDIVIQSSKLLNKLSGYPISKKSKWFPFIPISPSSSTPS